MLELKFFVRVQTFRRRPFMPSHNFWHPVLMFYHLDELKGTAAHQTHAGLDMHRSQEEKEEQAGKACNVNNVKRIQAAAAGDIRYLRGWQKNNGQHQQTLLHLFLLVKLFSKSRS